jgi:hypothetical protein
MRVLNIPALGFRKGRGVDRLFQFGFNGTRLCATRVIALQAIQLGLQFLDFRDKRVNLRFLYVVIGGAGRAGGGKTGRAGAGA